MIYAANIETVKVTYPKTSPKRTELKITKGLVYKVEFCFPAGSAGLMGVAVFDGSYQVWPSTIGQWFVGDDVTISFDDMYVKEAAPYHFTIYTYNDCTGYNHSVDVRVGMVSRDIFKARFLPSVGNEQFIALLREWEVERQQLAEAQRQEILANPFPWLTIPEQIEAK